MNDIIEKPKDQYEIYNYARKLNIPPYRMIILKDLSTDNINHMINTNGNYLLFYHLNNNGFGHLCALVVDGPNIFFFDPTGTFIDRQTNYSSVYKSRKISQLLAIKDTNGYNIHYNPYKFQRNEPGINTCSLFCLLFLKYTSIHKGDVYDYLLYYLTPYKLSSEEYYDNALARYIINV